jgi:chromosome segregation ATPase
MTKKQKRFLEKTFKCLNINAEDLMKIKKIEQLEAENKSLKESVTFLDQALKTNTDALIKINAQVTELAKEFTNMQNEEIWGGKLDE